MSEFAICVHCHRGHRREGEEPGSCAFVHLLQDSGIYYRNGDGGTVDMIICGGFFFLHGVLE